MLGYYGCVNYPPPIKSSFYFISQSSSFSRLSFLSLCNLLSLITSLFLLLWIQGFHIASLLVIWAFFTVNTTLFVKKTLLMRVFILYLQKSLSSVHNNGRLQLHLHLQTHPWDVGRDIRGPQAMTSC